MPDPVEQATAAERPRSALAVARRAPLAALTLLTIVPVPARAQRDLGAREVAASAPWFPLVGAVLGLVIGAAAHEAAQHGSTTGAAVAVVLLAVVTGALHLDGLADCADALGARGGSPQRRLEIMRDSSTGAYGTAAIAGWFVMVAAAVAALPPNKITVSLVAALAFARAGAVVHAFALPPARAGGLGAGFQVGTRALVITAVVAAIIGLALAIAPTSGGWLGSPGSRPILGAAVGAVLAGLLTRTLADRLIGGRTGDTLGATIALSEAASLLVLVLVLG